MKKQRNKSISALNYLNEVSAIPAEIRLGYLNKLLRRENAENQKNIKLLKMIYRYIDGNKISSWDADLVCRKLDISVEMLYYHKHRLIKGLKEYYYKWMKFGKQDNEKKLDRPVNKNSVAEETILKIRKQAEAGMFEESKNLGLRLLKELDDDAIKPERRLIILSEIYENIIFFYFNCRKRGRIKFYLKEFAGAVSAFKNSSGRMNRIELETVNIRLKYGWYYLYCLEWYKDNLKVREMKELLKDVYDISKKINNNDYLLKVLHHRAIIEITSDRMDAAFKTCQEGARISREYNKETGFYTFASMLLFLKIKMSDNTFTGKHDKIIKYYKRAKSSSPMNLWTLYLENACAKAYDLQKDAGLLEIFLEQVNSNILIGDFSFSMYWRFVLESEKYMNRILQFFRQDEEEYAELGQVDEKFLAEIDELCLHTLRYHNVFNDIVFLWDVYLLKLSVLFLNEKNFDYEAALIVINKMDWLKKSRKKADSSLMFKLLKLSFKMIEYNNTRVHLFQHHLYELGIIIENYKKTANLNILDYAVLSSLARRLKSSEVTALVSNFYKWINNFHPEIIKPLLAEAGKITPQSPQ